MRKIILLILISIVVLMPSAYALKGVGIVYGTVVTNVDENAQSCFDYGVYNPWDEDIKVYLTVSGDLADLNPYSENIDLPAGTTHDQAKPVKLCFDIPKLHTIGCPDPVKSYAGKVIVTEYYPAGVKGTGSSTSVSAAAPLEMRVRCVESEKPAFQFNTQLFLIGAIIILILAAGYVGYRFFQTHKIIKKK